MHQLPSMNRLLRIIAVTTGLVLVGILLGSVVAIVPLLISVAPGGIDAHTLDHILNLGGGTGAVLGVILGPWVAWGRLRRAPLGAAVGHTFLGALAGASVGAVLSMLSDALFITIFLGALGGFTYAAERLAAAYPPTPEAPPSDAV